MAENILSPNQATKAAQIGTAAARLFTILDLLGYNEIKITQGYCSV
jgi:hypothetical protein